MKSGRSSCLLYLIQLCHKSKKIFAPAPRTKEGYAMPRLHQTSTEAANNMCRTPTLPSSYTHSKQCAVCTLGQQTQFVYETSDVAKPSTVSSQTNDTHVQTVHVPGCFSLPTQPGYEAKVCMHTYYLFTPFLLSLLYPAPLDYTWPTGLPQ